METIKINIDTNAQKATDNMKVFRNEIRELRSQLIVLTEGTEEYNQVLSELANKQFQLREMNENVRYTVTDLGEQLGTVANIASGVASGFSAVQATMTLFGAESENLQKTMVKLQAAMALVQGLQGLEDLGKQLGRAKIQFAGTIKSVKGFITALSGVKKALLATGIGVLVVALGALVANWDKVSEAIGGSDKEVEKLNNSINKLKESIKTDDRELDLFIKLKEIAGASRGEIIQLQREQTRLQLEEAQRAMDKAYDLLKNAKRRQKEERQKAYDEAVALEQELWDKLIALNDEYIIWEAQQRQDQLDEQEEDAEEARKRAFENAKKEAEAAVAGMKSVYDKQTNFGLSDYHKQYTDAVLDFTADKEKIDTYFERLIEATKNPAEKINKNLIGQFKQSVASFYGLTESQINEMSDKDWFDKINDEWTRSINVWKRQYDTALSIINDAELKNQLDAIVGAIDDDLKFKEKKIDIKYTLSGFEERFDFGQNWEDYLFPYQLEIDKEKELQAIRKAAFDERLTQMDIVLSTMSRDTEAYKELEKERTDYVLANNLAIKEDAIKLAQYQNKLEQEKINMQRITNQSVLETTSSLFGSLAELYGEGSEEYKTFATIQAVVDALSAANAAYKSMAGIPVVGPALGVAAAAAALISGYANVKAIRNTDENNLGEPQIPNVTSTIIPNEILSNALGTSSEISLQDELASTQKSTRVYVLESDITETQNAVKTQVEESTF